MKMKECAPAPTSAEADIKALSSADDVEKALQSTVEGRQAIEGDLDKYVGRSLQSAAIRAAELARIAQVAAGICHNAGDLSEVLDSSATSAEKISSRIRFLDMASSRGRAALRRVENILLLRVCAEGAKTALSAGDLAAAAGHVQKYRELDDDVRLDESSLAAVNQMDQSTAELARKVRERADQALRPEDSSVPSFPAALSAVSLFVPIGLGNEGFSRLTESICAQLGSELDATVRSLMSGSDEAIEDGTAHEEQPHIGALSSIFEITAGYLQDCEGGIVETFGDSALFALVVLLQAKCDASCERVLRRYADYRQLDDITVAVKARTTNPRDLDALLNELTLISQRAFAYFDFVRGCCRSHESSPAAPEEADQKNGLDLQQPASAEQTGHDIQDYAALDEHLSKTTLASELSRVRDYYVRFESYFMRQNVEKALRIDNHDDAQSLTSTGIDDTFFVLQKVTDRAFAHAGDVEALVTILSQVNSCLVGDLLPYLRRCLRDTEAELEKMLSAPSSGSSMQSAALTVSYLTELAKANIGQATGGNSGTAPGGQDGEHAVRYDYFVAVNNAAMSGDYATRFLRSVEHRLSQSDTERIAGTVPLRSVLGQIGDSARSISATSEEGISRLSVLLTSCVQSDVTKALDSVSFVVSDEAYAASESGAGAVSGLILRVIDGRALPQSIEERLTEGNWDTLVRLVSEWVADEVETRVFLPASKSESARGKRFNLLGGLCADREVRRLSAYFADKTRTGSVRDVFTRLSQMAILVNLSRPADIYDLWGAKSGGMTWRLSPTEVCRTLCLRVDFAEEAVRMLKL